MAAVRRKAANRPKKRGRQQRKGAAGSATHRFLKKLGGASFQSQNPAAFRDRKQQEKKIKKMLGG